MPQLRMLDGVEIISDEKVKAENLHGYDLQDREIIFKSLMPEEKFVDRRISRIEDIQVESDSDEEGTGGIRNSQQENSQLQPSDQIKLESMGNSQGTDQSNFNKANMMARQYVGELISRVDFNQEKGSNSPRFIQE